jgi:peptidoglycan-N-acetylmuramic acid deacetylase
MKTRIFNVLTALTLCLTILTPTVAAKSPCNWYCVHTANHQRPKVDAALSYIEKYDGYYIAPETQGKVIYLTFDAGYENGNVAKILDILKEKEVHAAFFILSHLIEKDTALVERMFEEGHTVCNHTAKHKDLSLADQATFRGELESLATLCQKLTGREMAKFYRPPEGRFSEENLKWAQAMGYRTIFWSFAYADWDNRKQMNPDKAKQKILSNIHPGEVMLLHPTSETNAQVLGEVIDECRRMGYRFGTLDELTARA